MSKWVIELPWLQNIIDLEKLKENYPYDETKNDPWRGVNCYEVTYKQKEIRNFMDRFHNHKEWSKPPTYWLTHKSEGSWISPHIDKTRDAVLLFPILPKFHTIHFLKDIEDSNSIIHSHTYRCPSIPHAKIPHCVKDKNIERWFLQISLHLKEYTWEKINGLVSLSLLFNVT